MLWVFKFRLLFQSFVSSCLNNKTTVFLFQGGRITLGIRAHILVNSIRSLSSHLLGHREKGTDRNCLPERTVQERRQDVNKIKKPV